MPPYILPTYIVEPNEAVLDPKQTTVGTAVHMVDAGASVPTMTDAAEPEIDRPEIDGPEIDESSAPTKPGPLSAVDSRALRSVATQFFINGAVAGTILARYPELREQVGVSLGRWGLLLTLAGAFGLVGSAITSYLIGSFTTRKVLILGAAVQVSLIALVGLSVTPPMLLIALGGIAMVDVTVDVSMNLQGSWISSRRHVPVMNRLHGLWAMGALVGGFISSQMARLGVPLRWHMIGAALALLPMLWFVGRGLLGEDERPAAEMRGEQPKAARYSMGLVMVAFAFAAAGAFTSEIVPNDWSALRLSTDLGAGPGAAALGYVAFTAGMTIGRFGGDFLMLRIGREALFWASVATTSVGVVLSFVIPSTAIAYVGFVLAGLGVATFFPTIYDEAAQFPGRTGAALGALSAGSRGAGLLVPSVIGAVSATSLSLGSAAAIIAIPAVAILAVTHAWLRHASTG